MKNLNNTILFSGGGTLGSVMPLIGIYEDLLEKYPDYKYMWVGTKNGPEVKIITELESNNLNSKIEFISISSGKLRRYFDFKNFIDIFRIKIGFLQSIKLLLKNRPKIVLTAGGFVSVPLTIAARILRIPVFIHQQDFEVGLANKIMAKFSNKITITLNDSLSDYKKYENKVVKTGNFVRKRIFSFDLEVSRNDFDIKSKKPILLIIGGGTGSIFINNFVKNNLDKILENYEIIHLTGINKNNIEEELLIPEYHIFEFLTEKMKDALNLADVIITRAGFSTLTEICALKKPCIILPLPGHQEKNANLFKEKAVVLDQNKFNENEVLEMLKILANNKEKRIEIGERICSVIEIGNKKMIELIEEKIKE